MRSMSMPKTLILGLLAIILTPCPAAELQCRVEIKTPKPGERVEATSVVQGQGQIPKGTHLWVLARRKGIELWWPQGDVNLSIKKNGDWEASVTFGDSSDHGREFEVAAIVVDEEVSRRLDKWFQDSMISGSFPGIRLPDVVSGCAVAQVTVLRK